MIKKTIILLFVLTAITVTSCKKDFLEINEDPSKATVVPPNLLLPSIESQIAFAQGGDAGRYAGIFMQHFTGASRQHYQYQIYNISPADLDNLWKFNIYAGPLQDLHLLEKMCEANGYNRYNALSKILMAYGLGFTTDLWGDIPYSAAFQGTDVLQPSFDTQESIYGVIQKKLDDAIALLQNSDPGAIIPGSEDKIFGGANDATQTGKWIRFAHSLKARYYLHLVKRVPSNANLVLQEASLGFLPGEVAKISFGTSALNANPYYQFNDERGDVSYSGTLIDYMISTSDPRVDYYVDTATSELGDFFGKISSPVEYMTYPELKFIEAEAAFRTADLTGAADAHNEAVKASVLRITGASDSTFEANNASETGATITLDKIMTQKYVAMFTNPESWADWRRTNIPSLTPTVGGSQVPRSFWYPESETNYNTNTPPNTSLQRRVWWDL